MEDSKDLYYTALELMEPSHELLEACDYSFIMASRECARDLRDSGEFENALELLERLETAQERVYGTDDIDYLRTIFEIGLVLQRQHRDEDSEKLLENLLAARERVLGAEHPHTLNTSIALADNYRSLGRLTEAEALFDKAIPITEAQRGADDIATLNAKNNLALLYTSQGKLEAAKEILQACMTAMEEQVDYDSYNLLAITENFADVQKKLRQRAEAEYLYNKILVIKTRNWGSEHPDTLDSMKKLAGFYEEDPYVHIDQAVELWERIVETQKEVLGNRHPDTIRSHYDLAHACFKQEDYARTLAMAESLPGAEMGASKPGTDATSELESRWKLTRCFLLARCYQMLGRYSESEELLQSLMDAPELQDDDNETLFLSCIIWMGTLRKRQGRLEQAEEYLKRALAGMDLESSAGRAGTSGCIGELVDLYNDQKTPSKGEVLLQEHLTNVERRHGNDSLKTAEAIVKLALFYENQERWEEASHCMARALRIREEKLGPDHNECLVPIQGLALCAHVLETGDRGAAMYARAIPGLERSLGPQHQDTIDVMRNFLNVLHSQEKREEERALLDHCAELGVYFRRISDEDTGTPGEVSTDEEKNCQEDNIGIKTRGPPLRRLNTSHRHPYYRQSKL